MTIGDIGMDFSALVDANPGVKRDLETLQEALTKVRGLRNQGIKPKTYTLASPFQRHRGAEGKRITLSMKPSSAK